jgi:hypothetical protein
MQGQDPADVVARLDQIDRRIGELRDLLLEQRTVKDFYTTHEVAESVGKAEFTVREWCRLGRVAASKRACGRGKFQEWIVSHDELTRLRNEGLLPARKG